MTALYTDKLHKEVYGDGEPIVMLHGWAMHTGIWRDFAQLLAVKHQVVCLDLPGHGLSANLTPYTLEAVVDAIYAQLPEQASVLVGWSLGGNLALRLAEKYPERIRSLVLVASNPHFIKTESWPGMHPQVLQVFTDNLQRNCSQTLLRFMSLQVQGKADAKSSLRQIKRAMCECATPNIEALMSGLDILKSTDQREILRVLKIPLLMIFAEQDTLVPATVAEQCRLLSKQIDLKIIPGAGHIPFITHRQQMLSLMQDFIARKDD
ncbi:MAG: pimeloyl-ACP methyl ester esterase BioH [Methyloprofundus sp.]